ncbi:hypothetical protein GCM10010254_01360 [Streptomyces chromofuscus]|nr:hypothetical protein GCM10010254_01360 [Streptomyces chromofuscus]
MEQGVTPREGHLTHGGAQLRGLLVVERREERIAPQNVVHEFSPCRPAQGIWFPRVYQGTLVPILPDRPNSVICHKDAAPLTRGRWQGSNWALIFGVRGGCRCRGLGWPGVQNAGESTGLGG